MKHILFIFIICLLSYSCSDYVDRKEDSEKNDEIVIDKFTPLPFKIVKRPSIDLPDSLGGKDFSGKIVVTVDIDSIGNIVNYEINSFVTPKIKYFGDKNNYPVEIQKFNNWINEYLSQIVFTKNNVAQIKSINRINIPIRLNSD